MSALFLVFHTPSLAFGTPFIFAKNYRRPAASKPGVRRSLKGIPQTGIRVQAI
jgi:hypothetical protein